VVSSSFWYSAILLAKKHEYSSGYSQSKTFTQFQTQLTSKNHKEFGNKSAHQEKIHSCKSTARLVDTELGQLPSASFRCCHSCCIQAGCAADTFTHRPAGSPAGSTPSHFTYQDWAAGSLGLPSNRIASSLSRSFNWQKSTSLFPTRNSCLSLTGSHLAQSVVIFCPSVSVSLSDESSLGCRLNRPFLSHQISR